MAYSVSMQQVAKVLKDLAVTTHPDQKKTWFSTLAKALCAASVTGAVAVATALGRVIWTKMSHGIPMDSNGSGLGDFSPV
jgi:Mg/Co/Ni transporter MgtE